MPRLSIPVALCILSATSGCKALEREGHVVGYHPDLPPRAEAAPYDATYTLYTPDPEARLAYATIELRKGMTVGFRREPDGSLVAIAGEQVTPIPDARALWCHTPTPRSQIDRFAVETRDTCESVASAIVLTPFLVFAIISGDEVP